MMAQAEQNAEMQEDPVIQMQQKELQIKELSAQAKAQAEMAKIQADLQKAQGKAVLDMEKLQTSERIEAAKIAAKMKASEDSNRSREEIEGFKSGFNLVRDLIDDE